MVATFTGGAHNTLDDSRPSALKRELLSPAALTRELLLPAVLTRRLLADSADVRTAVAGRAGAGLMQAA